MYRRMEVHSHTHYSNLRLVDSINRPKDLVNRAIELGLAGIAITDHECLSGQMELNIYQKQIKEQYPDFKIAHGNEIYLVDERIPGQKYYHFILIAKDAIGNRQLRELSSRSWMLSYVDRGGERVPTTKEELHEVVEKNRGHLIATTACLGGELSSSVLEMENARRIGDTETADRAHNQIVTFILEMKELFGEDFYIEIAPGCSREQIMANRKLFEIAIVMECKVVIGTDAHFLAREDRYVHKAYLNSKDGEREVDAFYEYSYLQSNQEIFEHLSQSYGSGEYGNYSNLFESLCANSMEIYDKIEYYDLCHSQQIPKVEVKNYAPVPGIRIAPDASFKYMTLNLMMSSEDKVERYWVNECLNKLKELNKYNDIYLERLEEEARVKKIIGEKLNTNMFSYPVTLQHYVDMFWECGSIVGAGRGSSCSGLNHYLLGITQLDPIEWDLPFWRYLNDERVELGSL